MVEKIKGSKVSVNREDTVGVRGKGKEIEVALPERATKRIAREAALGNAKIDFDEMIVSDGYDDTQTIRYSWDLDNLSGREWEDMKKTVERVHDEYDVVNEGVTEEEYVIRLDYL